MYQTIDKIPGYNWQELKVLAMHICHSTPFTTRPCNLSQRGKALRSLHTQLIQPSHVSNQSQYQDLDEIHARCQIIGS